MTLEPLGINRRDEQNQIPFNPSQLLILYFKTVILYFLLLAPVEGLFFKPKYRANILYLFKFHCCFIYFPVFAVGIRVPFFFAQYVLILTDPGLQRSGTLLHWFVVVVLPILQDLVVNKPIKVCWKKYKRLVNKAFLATHISV